MSGSWDVHEAAKAGLAKQKAGGTPSPAELLAIKAVQKENSVGPAPANPFATPVITPLPDILGDYVPDWYSLEQGQNEALKGAAQGGEASALGALNRMGLIGSGAEAGVRQHTGEVLGKGAIDIKNALIGQRVNWEDLQAQKRLTYALAKAQFDQGNYQGAQNTIAQYDALNAQLMDRRMQQESGGDSLGGILGGVAGAFLGGPGGAVVGKKLFD